MVRQLSSAFSRSRPGAPSQPALRFSLLAGAFLMLVSLLPWAAYGRQDDGASDLVGEYTVTIIEDDVPLNLIGGPGLVGDWKITFAPGGAYSIERMDLGTMVTGTYTVDGQTVTVTDEAGLLSCANPQPDGSSAPTATYSWELIGERLQLQAIEENCATRQLLFTTRSLAFFVACLTPSEGVAGGREVEEALTEDETDVEDEATPAAERDPNAVLHGAAEATPAADEQATPAGATPTSGTPVGGTPVAEETVVREIATQDDPAEAIDDLLSQMTACWATGDPLRVIPLFSPLLIENLTGGGAVEIEDLVLTLLPLQTVPITWERAGEVTLTNDEGTEAEAIVSLSIGGEEEFTTLQFVLTDEGWRFLTFLPE